MLKLMPAALNDEGAFEAAAANARAVRLRLAQEGAGALGLVAAPEDRRTSQRQKSSGRAMAVFVSPDGSRRMGAVGLVDSSVSGLGLLSSIEVEPGTLVTIHFDNHPSTWGAPGRTGVVRRCERQVDAETKAFMGCWRVGVATRARAVAA